MAFSLITHVAAQSSDAAAVTTAGATTTGATLIVVAAVALHGTTNTPTDSNSNSWTSLTRRDTAAGPGVQLYYVVSPIVGAGHTFSLSPGASSFPAITVTAWSGNDLISPFDVENGGSTASATTIATGSVSPSQNNSLVIAAAAHTEVFASSVDSGFTISDDEQGASNLAFGNVMAYSIQTTATAVNPTYSGDGSNHQWAAAIVAFREPVAVGAVAPPFFRPKFRPRWG